MLASSSPSRNPAQDGFERYYAEKIWEWIPSTYRHEDGLADPPYVLRAIVEILARHAAIARRTSDRLWEDQFIQTCDDWAVPYIGNLVGTRLVGSLSRRTRRVDVARTIFYRRRKGTPVVMQALIQDITEWEGVVVESFKRLARARYRLDPEPARFVGPLSGTPPGGTADLRIGRAADVLDGPFDDMSHTADFRRIEGYQGRYNIPKLNFFLYRLFAFELAKATPWDFGNQRFTFDPSGRDIALFRPSSRRGNTDWTPVQEWQLPAPIPCRLLEQFKPNLIPNAVALAVTSSEADGASLPPESIQAGNLVDWSLPAAPGIAAFIDPVLGRFSLTMVPGGEDKIFALRYHYGFSGEVGAGTYDRSQSVLQDGVTDFDGAPGQPGPVTSFSLPSTGAHQFINSKTYQPDAPADNVVDAVEELVLQGADQERPYLTLVPADDKTHWIFRATPKVSEDEVRMLTLEGLWLGILPTGIAPETDSEFTAFETLLVLDGDFDCVRISHCTLDPGGERARVDPSICEVIPSVSLEIRGQIQELIIESSIVGPIRESTSKTDPCSIGKIVIRDSIVQSLLRGVAAIETRVAELTLERVTVFGDISVNRLDATEALIQGTVRVLDNQHGCFRFSTASDTPEKRMPRRYESPLFAPQIPNHFFSSRRFGDPDFAQLSARAPDTIARGAENRGEMGAFNSLLNPIKRDDLETKVFEFMPFGLIPQFIFET
ncbi:MAG TPA: hypothetical protein VIS96_03420 [Terrimicrobiaceae bacterium]